ncbi:NUDIX domain-containing protein [Pseudomonas asiatica]|uniref:NUDIX domain-containing protein n=1 Tax=Pseudomonas asiatica TaxID=2219225 RepID=UPI0037C66AD8
MNNARERHSTVICLQAGRILFVRKQGAEWALPGGKIDPGEHHVDTAQRELMEETCLPFNGARFLNHYVLAGEEHYLYQLPVEAGAKPAADHEIVECRWFTAPELHQVRVKPSNIELLEREHLLPV